MMKYLQTLVKQVKMYCFLNWEVSYAGSAVSSMPRLCRINVIQPYYSYIFIKIRHVKLLQKRTMENFGAHGIFSIDLKSHIVVWKLWKSTFPARPCRVF